LLPYSRSVTDTLCYNLNVPFTLAGKSALVTGAGRGIGRAIAARLAQLGAAVMVNDLDAQAVDEAVGVISGGGARVQGIAGDITDPALPGRLVDTAIEQFGSLDIVVNNAGYTWDNVIQKTTDQQFQAMLDVHLVAPFRILRAAAHFIRAAAKQEIAEGRRVMRKVVNITSISGIDGNPGQIGYSSGKAGIVGMTKTMAKEWGRYNVNVNAVGFGIIETRLTQPLTGPGASIEMKGRTIPIGVQPQALEAVRERCPLGRLGTVDEAAGAVLFFCSPLSDYVTGEVLICGGGLHF
jgi:3-oxoacyl-[acyl-carrier protein] reductase